MNMTDPFVVNATNFNIYQKNVITTQTLLDLCGAMDHQAFYTAVFGFCLSILMIIYYGRLRKMIEQHPKIPTWVIPFIDKLILTGIALCFAIIITRLLRAS